MLYEVRTKLSESGRRVRLERLDMDHVRVWSSTGVAWHGKTSRHSAKRHGC